MNTTVSTMEILNNGMRCLKEQLGVVEAERFISVIIREQFDYTKWQMQYFDKMSDDEFNAAAAEYAKAHSHGGNAKKVL